MKTICIMLALLIMNPLPALCANLYIAPTAAGSGDGSSCLNAEAAPGTWTAVGGGDTVYLCSGTYGSTLTIPKGGTASAITIKALAGASFSAPFWGDTTAAAIYASGKSFITIDGDNVGIIEATANGTALANQAANSRAIYITNGNNIMVKNWTIKNLYVRTAGSTTDAVSSGYGVTLDKVAIATLSGNMMRHMKFGVSVGSNNSSPAAIYIHGNDIRDISTGIVVGITGLAGGHTIDDVQIYNNTIDYGLGTWKTQAAHHNDGIHCWGMANNTDRITNLKIYGNKFTGDPGAWSSGNVYLEYDVVSPLIYNNVFANSTTENSLGNIALKRRGAGPDIPASSPGIYNNTIIGLAGAGGGGTGIYIAGAADWSPVIKNNTMQSLYGGVWDRDAVATVITADNNIYYDVANVGRVLDTWKASLATWQTYLGAPNEVSSLTSDPLLDADGAPGPGSPAIGAGADLSAYFTSDFYGHKRPSVWDIGAIQTYRSHTGGTVSGGVMQ